jgi:hypothetical protein
MIETVAALQAHAVAAIVGRARSRRLDLDVWLLHARSGYAAMNFSTEKTVSRDSM